MQCHGCGAEIRIEDKIFRGDTCLSCGRALHACKNCVFYDRSAYHQCRETQAEWVSDKDSANFCDYFRPAASGPPGGDRGASRSEQARKKLDDLFKK